VNRSYAAMVRTNHQAGGVAGRGTIVLLLVGGAPCQMVWQRAKTERNGTG
jgi:hypothetical protein